ncbi:MAG: 6-phosphogluconolactonase [Crocinitomicaceae bacterium]|nr:6-phosphogluconolactonase [Crocinitomicaceae bacterium]
MIEFESKAVLEQALAQAITTALKDAIAAKGEATLLLSGGSTPSGVYALLSQMELPWQQVTVGLVDERFVGPTSPYSNFKLIGETLLQNKAKAATLVPMVSNESDYEENLRQIEDTYRIFTDTDVCLLGMGPDGHTASIFPNDPASVAANLESTCLLSNTNAPATPTQRITCNGPLLRRSKHLFLMITGTQKKEILEQSEQLQLPIAAFKSALTETYYTTAS